jgi:hypothetical protein
MRSDRLLLAALGTFLVTTAALSFAPASAHAFCRTRTTPTPPDFEPGAAGEGCFEQGVPLYHLSQCVPYHLLSQPSTVLPTPDLSNAIARAFATWTAPNATCTPGITGIELAPVNDAKIVDYTVGQRGHNVFGVVKGAWPHAGGGETLSLATLTFNADTGEIYDADLEIREDLPWSIADTAPKDGYDLQAVMTHEVGHVLGLAHSNHVEDVMFGTYPTGSTAQRKLAPDDAAAVCSVYPDRQTRRVLDNKVASSTACDLSPSAGSSGACGDPVITHGCGTAGTTPSRDGVSLAGLGILAALAWRLRRRLQRA